jgi:hypothetical protein
MKKMVTKKEAFDKVKMVAKSGGFVFGIATVENVAKAYEEFLSLLTEEEKDLTFSTFGITFKRRDIPRLLRENKQFAEKFITKYLNA